MTADDYNQRRLTSGAVTAATVTAVTREAQRAMAAAGSPVDVDGMLGPITVAALGVDIVRGWLSGPSARVVPADPSWYGGSMAPVAVVWHYTATDPGTADAMARRRARPREATDRAASWHVTVAADGTMWQSVPFTSSAWHVAAGRIAGRKPNSCSIGVELEGHGESFPAAQRAAALSLLRALAAGYSIDRVNAGWAHSALDPDRRRDPGPIWERRYMPEILAAVYG